MDEEEYDVRGFPGFRFRDSYRNHCSIQVSSNVKPSLWLGVDKPFDGYKATDGDDTQMRMHLSVEEARWLRDRLTYFVHNEWLVSLHEVRETPGPS